MATPKNRLVTCHHFSGVWPFHFFGGSLYSISIGFSTSFWPPLRGPHPCSARLGRTTGATRVHCSQLISSWSTRTWPSIQMGSRGIRCWSCRWKKACTTFSWLKPYNNGINLWTGAGILPSIVSCKYDGSIMRIFYVLLFWEIRNAIW